MSRRNRPGPEERELKVKKLLCSASVTQDSCRFRHKVTDLADPNEIEIEVYPDEKRKNIARVNGLYQGYQKQITPQELEGLPLRLGGVGGNLADKMDFQLKGQVDRKGKFNVFVTGVATTMVQFKLWGEVFPDAERPFGEVSPELFREEVFRQLRRQQNSEVPGLREWVRGMLSFWDKWQGVFQMDVQKDLLARLEDFRADLGFRLRRQDEILSRVCERLLVLEGKVQELQRQGLEQRNMTRAGLAASIFQA